MLILPLPAWRKARIVVFSTVVLVAACGQKTPPPQGEMKVPVSVVTVQPARTEVFAELPGRVEAIKDAEVRARVNGIVIKVNFQQGSDVKAGQLLFTIDPAPYRAVRDQAAAALKKAEADVHSARLLAQRYSQLIKANAVSRQEYDNALATAAQGEAAVAGAKAALAAAEIDLGYTKVVSPIDGRIGKSYVTEGALVSATGATQLAVVQQLDRVYVDLTRSTSELAQLRRAMANGELERVTEGEAKAQAVLEDGSLYDKSGKLLFSGITVDPTTGQVNLRAEFPNPDQILLPGMYVRVRLTQGVDPKALLVPQQALQRTADGANSLVIVKDGKAHPTPVSVGAQVGGKSIITQGLNAGDVVVVEGFQKIRPGGAVQPMPWQDKSNAGAPVPGAAPAASSPGGKTTSTEPSSKG